MSRADNDHGGAASSVPEGGAGASAGGAAFSAAYAALTVGGGEDEIQPGYPAEEGEQSRAPRTWTGTDDDGNDDDHDDDHDDDDDVDDDKDDENDDKDEDYVASAEERVVVSSLPAHGRRPRMLTRRQRRRGRRLLRQQIARRKGRGSPPSPTSSVQSSLSERFDASTHADLAGGTADDASVHRRPLKPGKLWAPDPDALRVGKQSTPVEPGAQPVYGRRSLLYDPAALQGEPSWFRAGLMRKAAALREDAAALREDAAAAAAAAAAVGPDADLGLGDLDADDAEANRIFQLPANWVAKDHELPPELLDRHIQVIHVETVNSSGVFRLRDLKVDHLANLTKIFANYQYGNANQMITVTPAAQPPAAPAGHSSGSRKHRSPRWELMDGFHRLIVLKQLYRRTRMTVFSDIIAMVVTRKDKALITPEQRRAFGERANACNDVRARQSMADKLSTVHCLLTALEHQYPDRRFGRDEASVKLVVARLMPQDTDAAFFQLRNKDGKACCESVVRQIVRVALSVRREGRASRTLKRTLEEIERTPDNLKSSQPLLDYASFAAKGFVNPPHNDAHSLDLYQEFAINLAHDWTGRGVGGRHTVPAGHGRRRLAPRNRLVHGAESKFFGALAVVAARVAEAGAQLNRQPSMAVLDDWVNPHAEEDDRKTVRAWLATFFLSYVLPDAEWAKSTTRPSHESQPWLVSREAEIATMLYQVAHDGALPPPPSPPRSPPAAASSSARPPPAAAGSTAAEAASKSPAVEGGESGLGGNADDEGHGSSHRDAGAGGGDASSPVRRTHDGSGDADVSHGAAGGGAAADDGPCDKNSGRGSDNVSSDSSSGSDNDSSDSSSGSDNDSDNDSSDKGGRHGAGRDGAGGGRRTVGGGGGETAPQGGPTSADAVVTPVRDRVAATARALAESAALKARAGHPARTSGGDGAPTVPLRTGGGIGFTSSESGGGSGQGRKSPVVDPEASQPPSSAPSALDGDPAGPLPDAPVTSAGNDGGGNDAGGSAPEPESGDASPREAGSGAGISRRSSRRGTKRKHLPSPPEQSSRPTRKRPSHAQRTSRTAPSPSAPPAKRRKAHYTVGTPVKLTPEENKEVEIAPMLQWQYCGKVRWSGWTTPQARGRTGERGSKHAVHRLVQVNVCILTPSDPYRAKAGPAESSLHTLRYSLTHSRALSRTHACSNLSEKSSLAQTIQRESGPRKGEPQPA
ncbi:hypothetical protein MMPV_009717 [Pyropia vietnamensis]